MDKKGFRTMLEGRKVPAEQIEPALALAERLEAFLQQQGAFTREAAWAFSTTLIAEGLNTVENFLTLARYGLFTNQREIFVAFLEVLDGGEAQENLYQRVAERHSEQLRDAVFTGIGLAPYGLPVAEKPAFMQPVIARLEQALGAEACRALLADSLRDLPDYAWERDIYLSCENVDAYLQHRKARFVAELEACQRERRLFFAQEVTAAVLDFVRRQPEIGGGARVGRIVYETKIPFMTQAYLDATDPTLKRYTYCHCPWAREAVRSGATVAPIFCNCSAGFHKKPWVAALAQDVQVDVLESVLQGDDRCRFAIHLPEGVG